MLQFFKLPLEGEDHPHSGVILIYRLMWPKNKARKCFRSYFIGPRILLEQIRLKAPIYVLWNIILIEQKKYAALLYANALKAMAKTYQKPGH